MEESRKYRRVKTTVLAAKTDGKTNKAKTKNSESSRLNKSISASKYSDAYGDFSAHATSLKGHQVLAIRRGVQKKVLKMSYDLDSEKVSGRKNARRLRNGPVRSSRIISKEPYWHRPTFRKSLYWRWIQGLLPGSSACCSIRGLMSSD